MSKEQFFMMRLQEMQQFDATFTKKEAKKTGEDLVINALESGNIGKFELMANLVRLQEVVTSAVSKLREELPHEKTELMGVKFEPRDGGNSVNYEEDPIYLDLKNQIKHREELLKLASKSNIETYDQEGILIPCVGTTPRKSSITISF